MLNRPLVWALCAAPVLAQSNAVPGMDVQIFEVTDIAYYGRQGAAYPTGEAGFMVGHSHCNAGIVNVPWVATAGGVMIDTYPKIAFLLARESGGRMVQISRQGHSKHSMVPFNFASGPCAPCVTSGSGFFFVGCSDTYGSGTNASQFNLGPNSEIDPWLGTWNSQGSYFDSGDPAVSGASATDRVRSLTSTQVGAFGPVKNRIVVQESELLAGASYFAQAQVVIQGEPGDNRGNNARCRPVSIAGNGSGWTVGTAGSSQHGSVLTLWSGATFDKARNGGDDGHFLVANKTTGPVGGVYHYEYAVHNLDNARAGATIRIPVDAAAVVTAQGFRDVDGNPLNDWTFARVGNELVWSAPAGNAIEWNTFYNVWFDCTVAPSYGYVHVDQARPGPGALTVSVPIEVPSGIPAARKELVGHACGSCTSVAYEIFSSPGQFDLDNRSMTFTLNGGAYTVADTGAAFVAPTGTPLALTDDSETTLALPFALPYPGGTTTQLRVCSNGFVSPAASNGTALTATASGLLQGQPRWAIAWHDFNPAAAGSGQVIADVGPSEVRVTWNGVNNFSGGGTGTFQARFLPNGTVHFVWGAMTLAGNGYGVGWSPGAVSQDPGPLDLSLALQGTITFCATSFSGVTLNASARPVLGTTLQWQIGSIPGGSPIAALVRGLQRANPPVDLTAIGMPGCEAYLLDPVLGAFVPVGASAQFPETIPNVSALIGVELIGQALVVNAPLTPSGLVSSNGVVLTLGL